MLKGVNKYKSYYYLYKLLIEKNATAKPPLWNSVLEVPIPVDNTIIKNNNDEYVYWNN